MRIIKKIIRKLYHLIWFLSAFLLFSPIVNATDGIINGSIYSSDISASAQAQWYDVNHNEISTTLINTPYFSPYFQAGARYNSYLSFNVYTNLQTNVLYSLTVYLNDNSNSNLTAWNNAVATGTYNGGANSNNSDSTCRADIYSFVDSYNIKYKININEDGTNEANTGAYYITFRPTCRGNYLNIPVAFSNPGTYMYFYGYHLEVLGLTDGLTSNDISSVINSSGLATANSVSQVQSSVSQVQQELSNLEETEIQNTQDIINNQNENTDKTNETIDSNFNSCEEKTIINNFDDNPTKGKLLDVNGNYTTFANGSVSDYISIEKNNDYVISPNNATLNTASFCLYDKNKTLISCTQFQNRSSISFNSGSATFLRTSNGKTSTPISITGKFCKNRLDSLNDNITNDDAPDIDLDLDVSSDTPISDLITMPLTILNSLINTLNDSCSNYTLPFFFNTTITLPCFTISDYLGSNITNYIDLFICLYMCYEIGMLVVSIFEDITSLRDIYDSLYVPRHADTGYKPRHAKGGAN